MSTRFFFSSSVGFPFELSRHALSECGFLRLGGASRIPILPFRGSWRLMNIFRKRVHYFWKIAFGTNAWMPLTPSTAWVTTRSIVALSNM